MVAQIPALVLQPRSPQPMSAAGVDFARQHGLRLEHQGWGPTTLPGRPWRIGGLMLDMSLYAAASTVDADRPVGPCWTRLPASRTWTPQRQEHGLATVLGFVSEVGVAGLTLGGGFGYLMRRFGWAADNLVEVEIVTADGRVRTASRESDSDLFWALRGGGGNFGVVTRFTYRLHEVGPTITGGLIAWGAERVGEVLETYRTLTESAPRELTVALVLRLAPPAPFIPPEWHGRHILAMLVCHSGADPESDLAPIRALGDPVTDLIERRPYVEQQSILDGMEPNGWHYYWKTGYLQALSDGFLQAFRDGGLKVPSVCSESVIFHVAGAANDRAGDDGAVGNRDVRYITGFAGSWPADSAPEEYVRWARDSWSAVEPFATDGSYVNFHLAEDGPDRTAQAYGPLYARLRGIKRRYDPQNLFRANRNIAPAAEQ